MNNKINKPIIPNIINLLRYLYTFVGIFIIIKLIGNDIPSTIACLMKK